jgi:hypothetical protein
MKKVLVAGALTAVLAGGFDGGPAVAGSNFLVRATVHVTAYSAKRDCSSGIPAVNGCSELETTEAATDVDCFPVFYDMSEYKGCEYGLTWPGTYTCTFTSCSDLLIGDVVDPGDGVSHVWFSCESRRLMIPGWARIYEPGGGRVCLTGHPQTGIINVLDCGGELDSPESAPSCAGIGGRAGDDPCGGDSPPRQEETWGEIKTMFD